MSWGILFSGQGAQKAGMGLDFMTDPLFKQTIEQASTASRQDLIAIFKSEEGELQKTVHVQPALVAFEAGIFRMLKRDLPTLVIGGMVGLSLGEYSAMFASGSLDLKNCLSLVSDRARYMQADADKIENGMTALLEPDLTKIKEILGKLQAQDKRVYLANYNSPRQVVIAGVKGDVLAADREIKEAKACRRAVNLRVNGAFHTPLFANASKKMHERLKQVAFKPSQISVISNTTMKPFTNNWAEIMEKQLAVPTHFGSCVAYLIKQKKVNRTVEIGPGHTLSSFAKQVNPKLKSSRIGTLKQYRDFVEEINGLKK